ncbi:PucR family transcriptional regulator [Mycobacterium sp. CBMA247]|nr:PucR family transcriptional regulator [Mycolicibacterium sp. CBMA 329]MUL89414.1 PucR family transcriptional regulator [Mycolicibacterium sp. CBMA 331]MUL99103.1 PucR family transcriptional regulator [Mycolicibacterium sp. CBMA 334]MUM24729.1 PucR family transcriptional regulator [Mycolicibacterium sp. CBMA 295]MUM38930.1 PucR family transcriptional regulator [Mycolicibacterium sp. CBMA 247]
MHPPAWTRLRITSLAIGTPSAVRPHTDSSNAETSRSVSLSSTSSTSTSHSRAASSAARAASARSGSLTAPRPLTVEVKRVTSLLSQVPDPQSLACELRHGPFRCALITKAWPRLLNVEATERSMRLGGRCRVRDLLTALRGAGLTLVTDDVGLDQTVSRTVLFDPVEAVRAVPEGVLLGVGVDRRFVDPSTVITQASAAQVTAMVVKASALRESPELTATANRCGLALLTIDDMVDWLTVDAHIRSALYATTHAGGPLRSAPSGDLFSLVEAIADTLGGAAAIEDMNLRVLAYSSGQHPIDEDRRSGILGRRVPSAPEHPGQYREVYQSRSVCRIPGAPGGLDRLAVAVRAGPEIIGSVWVVIPPEGLRDGAQRQLADVAPVAALHLLRARHAEDLVRQQRTEAAEALIAGSGDLRDAILVLDFDPDSTVVVMTIAVTSPVDRRPARHDRFVSLVTMNCESRRLSVGVAGAGDLLHVVCSARHIGSADDALPVAEAIRRAVRSSLDLDAVIGIGPAVSAAHRIRHSAECAAKVATLLRRVAELPRIATSRQMADRTSFVDLAAAAVDDPRMISDRVVEILKHDEEHSTTYAKLLRTYLRSWRDATRTATMLTIHPNTVRYRLNRLSATFGIDLDDPDQLLPIWVGLEVQNLTGAVVTG